jgi:uncharacterized protein with PIN domain
VGVPLYFDEHVPRPITRGLRARGVDVLTVQEDGFDTAPDPEVLDRAGALGRIVFTRDRDFLREAARRQAAGQKFAGVIYSHQMRLSYGECIIELELIAKASDPREYHDRVTHIPL